MVQLISMLMVKSVRVEPVATSLVNHEVVRSPSNPRSQSHPRSQSRQKRTIAPLQAPTLRRAHPLQKAHLPESLLATRKAPKRSLTSGLSGPSTTVLTTLSPAITTVTGIRATATASANGSRSTVSQRTSESFTNCSTRQEIVASTPSTGRTGHRRYMSCACMSAGSNAKSFKSLLT